MIDNDKKSLFAASVFAVVASTVFTKPVQAIQITLNDFGAEASFESFEGITPEENAPAIQFRGLTGILKPGVSEPFTFRSGVTLTSPIPNDTPPSAAGVILGDFSVGSVGFALGANGSISAKDVPDGSAFLSSNSLYGTPFELTFPTPVLKVGGFVTASRGTRESFVTLSAFDSSGSFVESASIKSVKASDWKNNFLGIASDVGIQKITLSANEGFTGFSESIATIDRLIFEPVPEPESVPEPSIILGLIAAAITGLGLKRKSVVASLRD